MKCACIALLVFLFIVFGAGTPFIVYRSTGASETVPDANSTEPVQAGNGTTTNSTATTNGIATTNGNSTTTISTSLSGVPTRRALAACPQTDADALLATEGDDGTLVCTYASGACTYHSETGVLLDDQNGGSCPKESNVEDRARGSRRGIRYEAIAKRVLA